MHRDTKLGLALGMLVIGFAVAFCFPREDLPTQPYQPAAAQIPVVLQPVAVTPGPAVSNPEPTVAVDTVTPGPESPPAEAVTQIPVPEPQAHAVPAGDQTASSPVASLPPQPVTPAGTYLVQPGDTLSGIAGRLLGDTQRYYELFQANQSQLATPDALRSGMVLVLPPSGGEPETLTPEPEPTLALPASYEVRVGDTLEGIAQRFYGDRTMVPQLRSANPHVADPKKLTVGTKIDLPVLR